MKNTRATKGILLGCGLLALAACSKNSGSGTGSVQSATTLASTTQAQVKVGMKIYDGGTLIYDDASSTSMLALKANKTYNVVLTPSSAVSGLSYSVALTKTSAVGSTAQMSTMSSGNNNFMVSSQGDYSIKMVASAPKMLALTKSYTAAVSCTSPTFTANSLNANAISVSGSNNLYNVAASGIASSANGQAPYLCAFDPTGTGIIDTGFVDCAAGVPDFYNNYVGVRKVSVIVKDSCNTIYTVSKSVNAPYTVPSMPGNVFIYGQVSNASGSAMSDSRVDGVTYLAVNQNKGGHDIVQPAYNGSTFTITASQNYGMASSIPFGVNIAIQGLEGSVDVAHMSDNLSAANASIKSLSYSTDQAGDAKTAVTFANGNCTLSNQNIRVLYVSGTPCTSGNVSASGNTATVEVWGNYTCANEKNSSGSMTITGAFDGYVKLVDSCSGGGGGGGGIVPINL